MIPIIKETLTPNGIVAAVCLVVVLIAIAGVCIFKYRPDKEPESKLSVSEYGRTEKYIITNIKTGKIYSGYQRVFGEIKNGHMYDTKKLAETQMNIINQDYIF
ncbi:MAG: hypothetical protein COA36_16890 [Desulfotalea sp.]|nr:MAG: hypothetical protein COA36_16890 [Desulfotalea sp.]